MRQAGYYYVSSQVLSNVIDWEVGEWNGDHWKLPGLSQEWSDNQFKLIGPRIPDGPEELKEFARQCWLDGGKLYRPTQDDFDTFYKQLIDKS